MMMLLRSASVTGLCALLLAGCSPAPAPGESAAKEPVVVYAAYADKTYLPALFTRFTAQTGQIVIVRNGQVPGIVDDVIDKRVSPPADVLLTPSVAGVWRAAEEGELRPNFSAVVNDNVPAWLRDPDNFWVALSYRNAVLVYDRDEFTAADITTYENLAEPKFRRKLCLSSSSQTINRTVIAMLLRKLGPRGTELAVRSWVANLARPVFSTEELLLQALDSRECAIGIVSSTVAAAGIDPDSQLAIHTPAETYADAEAAGITRHARNPDGATALIDWMLQERVREQHATDLFALPVDSDAAAAAPLIHSAVRGEEARLLAERARYP